MQCFKGKEILNEDVKAFALTKEGGNLYLSIRDAASINVKNTYTLHLTLTLEDSTTLEASVKIPVKQTAVNLKLSTSKVTLNNTVADKATIGITCTTKNYASEKPVWQLMDKTGKVSAEGKLDISWENEKLHVSVNGNTEFGTAYKLLVSAAEGTKAATLTVTIPAENKSAITGTAKVTGNLDVIQDGTAIMVTPTWKNVAEADRTSKLTVKNGSGEDVTDQFLITEEAGKYVLTSAKNAQLDHSQKYTVVLTADFGGITAEATTALKLKMGSAKLTAEADRMTLFRKDKNSRIIFRVTSADKTLNDVSRVVIKDAKQQSMFELFDYGNGQFAIGYKDGVVPANLKSVNLTLDVFLEGNETAKANASVKVKMSIVP